MRIRPNRWLTAATCAATLLLAGAPAQAQQLRLMTGPQGGTWVPPGGSMTNMCARRRFRAGTDPKQDKDVDAIVYSAHIVAACSLPVDPVYAMVKAMVANLPDMVAISRYGGDRHVAVPHVGGGDVAARGPDLSRHAPAVRAGAGVAAVPGGARAQGAAPLVVLAVFAEAGLAKADMWAAGAQAVRIGAAGFIVPFMFVYEPALLMIGPWSQVLPAVVSTTIGCVLLAAGLFGYLLRECSPWQRLVLVAAARRFWRLRG